MEKNIYIDRQPVPLRDCCVMPQRDPYPGGHTFQLTLKRSEVDLSDAQLENICANELTFESSRRLLGAIIPMTESQSGKEPYKYFLNHISNALHVDGELKVSGICSEVRK